jgi:hypothetical protein
VLGTKKVMDFLLSLLSLHLLQEACFGYKVKEFLEGSLCWISWIAYVEEKTHRDTDRPRERERELEGRHRCAHTVTEDR